MRVGTLLLFLALSIVSVTEIQAQAKIGIVADKTPASYLLVTEGIVGGFVAPHVRSQIVILDRGGKYELFIMKQADRRAEKTFRSGTLSDKKFNGLFRGLAKQGVFELPRELPVGCQDIYKKDTSLAVFSGGKFWRNGGPAGCVQMQSKVQPSEEQLKVFDLVVTVLKKWSDQHTSEESDAKTFTEVLQLVQRDAAKKR